MRRSESDTQADTRSDKHPDTRSSPHTDTQPTDWRAPATLLAALLAFLLVHLALTAGCLATAYQLLAHFPETEARLPRLLGGAVAALMAFFLIRPLYFFAPRRPAPGVEILPGDAPELFALLGQLAEQVGAAIPRRVFLTHRPEIKPFYAPPGARLIPWGPLHLEIGAPLVNALKQEELAACLLLELGALGGKPLRALMPWIVLTRALGETLISHRDRLDWHWRRLANRDIRIAWIAAVLGAPAFALRTLLSRIFNPILAREAALATARTARARQLAEALLGRETAIHAEIRSQSVAELWSGLRLLLRRNRLEGMELADVFALQTIFHRRYLATLQLPDHVVPPPLPPADWPPQLEIPEDGDVNPGPWLIRAYERERLAWGQEALVAELGNPADPWHLFKTPSDLRQQITVHLLADLNVPADSPPQLARPPAGPADMEEALDRLLVRPGLQTEYLGWYVDGNSTLHVPTIAPLLAAPQGATGQYYAREAPLTTAGLYDQGALDAITRWRRLKADVMAAGQPGSDALAQQTRLVHEIDQGIRYAHLSAAEKLGEGWPAYLTGLLAVIHYTEHSLNRIDNAAQVARQSLRRARAPIRVSNRAYDDVLMAAADLCTEFRNFFNRQDEFVLCPALAEILGAEPGPLYLGHLTLRDIRPGELTDWFAEVNGWLEWIHWLIRNLAIGALDELLRSEARVRAMARGEQPLEPAPPAPQVPARYGTLVPGEALRPRAPLPGWSRFLVADKAPYPQARLGVALGLIGGILFLGTPWAHPPRVRVFAYNGLSRPVVVDIGGHHTQVAAHHHEALILPPGAGQTVITRLPDGPELERFTVDLAADARPVVYNIAGASPLAQWTAGKTPATVADLEALGNPRWITPRADIFFPSPAAARATVAPQASPSAPLALTSLANLSPWRQVQALGPGGDAPGLIRIHIRWDPEDSPITLGWLLLARGQPWFEEALQARLTDHPQEALGRVLEFLTRPPGARAQLCAKMGRSAAFPKDSGKDYFLASQCSPDPAEAERLLTEGLRRWPRDLWLGWRQGQTQVDAGALPAAEHSFFTLWHDYPGAAVLIGADYGRLRAPMADDPHPLIRVNELIRGDDHLAWLMLAEQNFPSEDQGARQLLAAGQLQEALAQPIADPTARAARVRMAAASRGASPALIQQALALPEGEGIDETTLWPSLALHHRERRTPPPPGLTRALDVHLALTLPEHRQRLLALLAQMSGQRPPASLEPLLAGLPPFLRGQGYQMGVIVYGAAAPKAWRDQARRLLFPREQVFLG